MSTNFERSDKGIKSLLKQPVREVEAGVYGTINARHALLNEFGTFKVPARPFLSPVIEQVKPAIMAKIRGVSFKDVDMAALGKIMATQVRKNIIDKKIPPNAPYTIWKKGFDDPLIETGSMLNSVNYKVLS